MNAKDCERCLSKTVVLGDEDCWEWQAFRNKDGYGSVNIEGKNVRAHRLFWEWEHGPIPTGLQVLHHCDNPPCCNPAHLFLGTVKDNVQDNYRKDRGGSPMAANSRKTSCIHGHPFSGDNLYIPPGRPRRVCLECRRARGRVNDRKRYSKRYPGKHPRG